MTQDSNCEKADDAGVLKAVAAGDEQALAELYDRHGTACYRLARHITVSNNLAEDAVQEAFIVLWTTAESYLPSRGSVRSWLLGLTHHKAVDLVRRETSQQRRQQRAQAAERVLSPSGGDDPAATTLAAMRATEVRSALIELPEAQRNAIALAYFGGYTQSQIAQMTGVPLGTVKTRTLSGMRRLRLRLADRDSRAEERSS